MHNKLDKDFQAATPSIHFQSNFHTNVSSLQEKHNQRPLHPQHGFKMRDVGFLVDDRLLPIGNTRAKIIHLIATLLAIPHAQGRGANVWFVNWHNPTPTSYTQVQGGFPVYTRQGLEDIFTATASRSNTDLAGTLTHILTPFSTTEEQLAEVPPLYLIVLVTKSHACSERICNLLRDISNKTGHLNAPADKLKVVFAQVDMTETEVTTFLAEFQKAIPSPTIVEAISADTIENHDNGLLCALAEPLDAALNSVGQ